MIQVVVKKKVSIVLVLGNNDTSLFLRSTNQSSKWYGNVWAMSKTEVNWQTSKWVSNARKLNDCPLLGRTARGCGDNRTICQTIVAAHSTTPCTFARESPSILASQLKDTIIVSCPMSVEPSTLTLYPLSRSATRHRSFLLQSEGYAKTRSRRLMHAISYNNTVKSTHLAHRHTQVNYTQDWSSSLFNFNPFALMHVMELRKEK